jgi:ribonuclease BN (tRNA processing enzyme)
MKITFIGCGDAFANELGNNSALIEWENTNLLIDIPDSNYSRIHQLNLDYSDIQNIFITHLHADHINGLERFAYYRKYATPVVRPNEEIPKPNLFIPETIYFGLWDSVKNGLGVTVDGIKSLEDYFNVQLIKVEYHSDSILQGIDDVGHFALNGINFSLTPSKHVPNMPVYGLFVEGEFYFSADSTFDEEALPYYLKRTKKVFHDIHFFDFPIASHASINDFKYINNDLKDKIFAMHYADTKINIDEVDGIKLVKPFKSIDI